MTIVGEGFIALVHFRLQPVISIPMIELLYQLRTIPLAICILISGFVLIVFPLIPNSVSVLVSELLCRFPVIEPRNSTVKPPTPIITPRIKQGVSIFRNRVWHNKRIIVVRHLPVGASRISPLKPIRISIIITILPANTLKLFLNKSRNTQCVKCITCEGVVHLSRITVCIPKEFILTVIPIKIALIKSFSVSCYLPIGSIKS